MHSSDPLLNPELQQSCDSGHREESPCCNQPPRETSARHVSHDCAEYSSTRADRSDNVSNPVDKVKQGTFGLRAVLPWDRAVEHRSGSERLCKREIDSPDQKQNDQ